MVPHIASNSCMKDTGPEAMPPKGLNLVQRWARLAIVVCSRNASSATFAFRAASIFRLVVCVIPRSVCYDGTARNPISQSVRNSGATSLVTPESFWTRAYLMVRIR